MREQPARKCKKPRVERDSEPEISCPRRKRTAIQDLPTELHDLIFDHLDIVDAFSLCMSNRYFWYLGQGRIRAYFMSFLGPWASHRILAVGANLDPGDFPPGMCADDKNLDEDGNPIDLSELGEDFTRPSIFLPCTLLGQLVDDDLRYIEQVGSCRSAVLEEAYPKPSSFYPKDEPWILRNLTTKEFVRSEAIALEPEHIHGPDIDFIGFGEVVLSRICWTSESSRIWLDGEDGNIKRGVWAGHRFDITTLSRHSRETKSDDWRDVSEEVAEEIAKIWESEFGSNWRQVITGAEWGTRLCTGRFLRYGIRPI
ncbi:hypothetical protein SLS55_010355 [Diplodia seriata]|uniref:F-box domain-containing protein n=1 Tax=Diplodia seriata TaxID=420778 RepID=A0ABR3BYA6_9PEZI